jgi:Glutathione S-transferase, N-terminal domain
MVLKLYGSPYSTCTQRVRTVMKEKGLDYELVPIDLAKGQQKVRTLSLGHVDWGWSDAEQGSGVPGETAFRPGSLPGRRRVHPLWYVSHASPNATGLPSRTNKEAG